MATLIDVVVLKCRKNISDGKLLKSCVIYRKKSASSQTVSTALIAHKVCQGQPPTFGSQSSKFRLTLNRFTVGGVTAERMNAVLLAHIENPLFARRHSGE